MTEIKNAATIVLIRQERQKNYVLMGKRNSRVSFMPCKYVFPGGAWDKVDTDVPFVQGVTNHQKKLLMLETDFSQSDSLGITAVRELWEETGLRLSTSGNFSDYPLSWKEFFSKNQGPNLSNLNFFFRAITPSGRPRRFDARFFFCNARHIFNDLDDFKQASGELSDLKWVEIFQAQYLELPRITKTVLEHLLGLIKANFKYYYVPFYAGRSEAFNEKKLWL